MVKLRRIAYYLNNWNKALKVKTEWSADISCGVYEE